MAYIQFLSEEINTKKEIYIDIMLSTYNINNIDYVYCFNNTDFNIVKTYDFNIKIKEEINLLDNDLDVYYESLEYPDEENPCVELNLIKNKRLVSLFSADKVRCKYLVFEFAREYLKIRPKNYFLFNQTDLYDLERIQNLALHSL